MEDNNKSYISEIRHILGTETDYKMIEHLLDDYHNYEIANIVISLSEEALDRLYQSLSTQRLAEVFEELMPKEAFELLDKMNITLIIRLFDLIETDDLVDIIEAIEDQEKQLLYLSMIPNERRKIVKSYLHFEEDMVGSIMNNNFAKIPMDITIKKAIKSLVDIAPLVEYLHNIYVVDHRNRLVGTLSLKELINYGNQKDTYVREVMVKNMVYLYPTTPIEEAIETMKNYDFQLLPVVNSDQVLIGTISFDDTLEALSEESSSDYASLAGLTDVDITADESVFSSIKKRMPWLVILLFINLITSSIITGFEDQLQTLTTLAIFMPLILNMAGNSSTQGLGVVIRLFATNQLKEKKMVLRHLFKEIFTGMINGFVIAVGLFSMVLIFGVIRGEVFSQSLQFAFVIGLSIQLALIVATLAGSLVPLLMKAIKVDPATASGPLITTINDILSLLIYFSLATMLIAGLS